MVLCKLRGLSRESYSPASSDAHKWHVDFFEFLLLKIPSLIVLVNKGTPSGGRAGRCVLPLLTESGFSRKEVMWAFIVSSTATYSYTHL